MLFCLFKGDEPPYYLITGQEYIIGRKRQTADIFIEDDQSISRKHATIKVGLNNAVLVDHGSKYRTTYQNQHLESNVEVILQDNDVIKFGVYQSIYRFQTVKIRTTGSCLKADVKNALKPDLNFLGAQLSKYWDEECTHLTASEILLNFKLLHALIDNKPIVTPEYWRKLAESVKNKKQSPSMKLYKPPIDEILLSNELDLCYNEKRTSLFLGKVFVFPTNKLTAQTKEVVLKTGGSCISWEENQLSVSEIFTGSDKYIFIALEDDMPESRSYQNAINHLRKIKQRPIPISEFGMAVLTASCQTDCNPNFDRVRQVFGKIEESEMNTEHNILLAPKTQSLNPLYGDSQLIKQEVVIPGTFESDMGDSQRHENVVPSPNPGFKRPMMIDSNETHPKKRKTGTKLIEESTMNKRKHEEDHTEVSQSAKRVENPFFSSQNQRAKNVTLKNPFKSSFSTNIPDDHPFKEFMESECDIKLSLQSSIIDGSQENHSKPGTSKSSTSYSSSRSVQKDDSSFFSSSTCSVSKIVPPRKNTNKPSKRPLSSIIEGRHWLSKSTNISCVSDGVDEHCAKLMSGVVINHVSMKDLLRKDYDVGLTMIEPGVFRSNRSEGVQNFKKFKKVLPKHSQSVVVRFNVSQVCRADADNDPNKTNNQRKNVNVEDSDDSESEDVRFRPVPKRPVATPKVFSKKRFDF